MQDTCPIEEESVHNLVLEDKYNSTDQLRISYSKYHEIEIGSSSPVKKGKGCSCKKGCGKNCGCKKKGMRCHSGCFCIGNCCVQCKEHEGDVGVALGIDVSLTA